ncbi:MAG: hypothetical protein KDA78_09570 [Planctomycetaceae bacterium]|nr:hypothetical protein [Planctomycetaceae bacterium]
MKFLSASLIVASGAAIIVSSQQSAAAIMNATHNSGFTQSGVMIGLGVIVVGILGWAVLLISDWIETPIPHQNQDSKGK